MSIISRTVLQNRVVYANVATAETLRDNRENVKKKIILRLSACDLSTYVSLRMCVGILPESQNSPGVRRVWVWRYGEEDRESSP